MTNPKPLIFMAAAFLALVVGLRINERLATRAVASARAEALPLVSTNFAKLNGCLVASDAPAKQPSIQIRRRARALGPETSRAWLRRCAEHASALEQSAHVRVPDSELSRIRAFARGIARTLSDGREPLGFDGLAELVKTMRLPPLSANVANVEGPPSARFAFDEATLPPVVSNASRITDISGDMLTLRVGDDPMWCRVEAAGIRCESPGPQVRRVSATLAERVGAAPGTRWARAPVELVDLIVGVPMPRPASAEKMAFLYSESATPMALSPVTLRTIAFEACALGEKRVLRFVGDPVPPADDTNLDTLFFFDGSRSLLGRAQLHVGFDRVRFDCTADGADLLYAKDASVRGGPAQFDVHRVRCSPDGCVDDSAVVSGLSERPLAVAFGVRVLMLRSSTEAGGLRMRIAPLAELSSAPERVVIDDASDGGFAVESLRAIGIEGGVAVVFRSRIGLHGVFVRDDESVVPLERLDSSPSDRAP